MTQNQGATRWEPGDTDPIGIPAVKNVTGAKLAQFDIYLGQLKHEVDRLERMSQNYPNDLNTIRMVTINDIVCRMEEILYG